MRYTALSCFRDFRCLASACPDTCCAGWEVDLDEPALACYRTLSGPLGDQVRSRIRQEDGYTFFAMEQGRCPFLNRDNLCDLILHYGESVLSTTCREHPRFWDEYGILTETCLAISCPEAARLLLEAPASLSVRETEEPACPDPELEEALFYFLLNKREALLAMLDSPLSVPEWFSALAQQADLIQCIMDRGMYQTDVIGTFVYRDDPAPAPALPEISGFLRTMRDMEFTNDRLLGLLDKAIAQCPAPDTLAQRMSSHRTETRNLLLYFLYRYLLRAVWDYEAAEKIRFAMYSVLAIFALAEALPGDFHDALRSASIRFSREVEHSDENLNLLFAYTSESPQ